MKTKCWMADETQGAYCLGCGCCSEDLLERYESRICVLQERIHNLNVELKDYLNDSSLTRRFYNRINIEKLEDEIDRNKRMLQYYEREIINVRKQRNLIADKR